MAAHCFVLELRSFVVDKLKIAGRAASDGQVVDPKRDGGVV